MLEEVVERQNMRAAYQQVKRNAGALGIDGMNVEELGPHLREEWQRIKEALHQVMSRVFEPGFSESSYGFALGAAPTTRC